MEAGVVFAGWIGPLDGLPMAAGIRLPVHWPGPDAMRVGVVCPHADKGTNSGELSPLAAMMPILRMSVGGYRPQYPVRKSTRLGDIERPATRKS